jgi:hypothetical protein
MWQLDTDRRAAHIGAALGYLGEDDRAPTYRVGRALYERTWANGAWEGPTEGRSELPPPDFLRAVCSCGWSSPVLVEMSPDPGSPNRLGLYREDKARAFWLAHALAATSAALPEGADQARTRVASWLQTLADCQPLAALTLAHQMRTDADEFEQRAVRHARALGIPWEDIGTAAGTTRQQIWRKHKGLAPLDKEEEPNVLRPAFLSPYQRDEGHPPYTITDLRPTTD